MNDSATRPNEKNVNPESKDTEDLIFIIVVDSCGKRKVFRTIEVKEAEVLICNDKNREDQKIFALWSPFGPGSGDPPPPPPPRP